MFFPASSISGCCAVGSAPALGAGGPGFESPHSDQNPSKSCDRGGFFIFRQSICCLLGMMVQACALGIRNFEESMDTHLWNKCAAFGRRALWARIQPNFKGAPTTALPERRDRGLPVPDGCCQAGRGARHHPWNRSAKTHVLAERARVFAPCQGKGKVLNFRY